MCGRFALKAPPSELVTRFGLDECVEFSPRYNISPGTDIPVIRQSPDGKRVLHLLRWGLIPHWAKDPGIGAKLNNARGESVAEKPSFREAFKRRRCLVPANGFYEWAVENHKKQPYYISLKSGELMAMGGLWESWKSSDGVIVRSVCIITTGANEVMTPIHDRMPVLIEPGNWQAWLNATTDEVLPLVAPYNFHEMCACPVSPRVNRTVEDDSGLIESVQKAEFQRLGLRDY